MHVVFDTNTLVSALLSPHGPPRRLLDAARAQVFELCSSPVLMADLIVSGDRHLHDLGGTYQGIRIVAPAEAVQLLNR